MSEYEYKDVEWAFEYGQKNPDCKLEDWFEHRSRIITKDELKYYEDVEYAKFNVTTTDNKRHEIYIFKFMNSPSKLTNFINKFVGHREYYSSTPMPGEWSGVMFALVSFDDNLFDMDKWKDYKDFKGIKYIENKKYKIKLVVDYDRTGWNDLDYSRWDRYEDRWERDEIAFWCQHTYWKAFMSRDTSIKFKPAIELFEVQK